MAFATPNNDEDIFAAPRFNMVECQLRPCGVRDAGLLRQFASVPRELFVAPLHKDIAYADCALPCAGGTREMLPPLSLGLLIELAALRAGDVVLDIAGSTGYAAAIMSGQAAAVIALEDQPHYGQIADSVWADLNIDNAVSVCAPLAEGAPKQAPFNVIFINGCVEVVPPSLLQQLDEDGRLVAAQMVEGARKAVVYSRDGSRQVHADIAAPDLTDFAAPPRFTF